MKKDTLELIKTTEDSYGLKKVLDELPMEEVKLIIKILKSNIGLFKNSLNNKNNFYFFKRFKLSEVDTMEVLITNSNDIEDLRVYEMDMTVTIYYNGGSYISAKGSGFSGGCNLTEANQLLKIIKAIKKERIKNRILSKFFKDNFKKDLKKIKNEEPVADTKSVYENCTAQLSKAAKAKLDQAEEKDKIRGSI